jgi:hypothetical protein
MFKANQIESPTTLKPYYDYLEEKLRQNKNCFSHYRKEERK